MAVDWFALADRPTEALRAELAIPPTSPGAVAAGSVTPWEPGGISEVQQRAGAAAAQAAGRPYDGFGATP